MIQKSQSTSPEFISSNFQNGYNSSEVLLSKKFILSKQGGGVCLSSVYLLFYTRILQLRINAIHGKYI